VEAYQQCGGKYGNCGKFCSNVAWGDRCCTKGFACSRIDDGYWQCKPNGTPAESPSPAAATPASASASPLPSPAPLAALSAKSEQPAAGGQQNSSTSPVAANAGAAAKLDLSSPGGNPSIQPVSIPASE
jgi:hypothetical protein